MAMRPPGEEQFDQDYKRWLGQAIRRERDRLEFTQESFAHHVGLDRGYMGRVERGEHNLTFLKLIVVLQGLRADPAAFFRDIHPRPHEPRGMRKGKLLKRSLSNLDDSSRMLGEAVACDRELAGLTQQELAQRVGLARSYVTGLECGKRNPTFTQLMRILDGLAIEPAEFFLHFPLPRKNRTRQLAT